MRFLVLGVIIFVVVLNILKTKNPLLLRSGSSVQWLLCEERNRSLELQSTLTSVVWMESKSKLLPTSAKATICELCVWGLPHRNQGNKILSCGDNLMATRVKKVSLLYSHYVYYSTLFFVSSTFEGGCG